MSDAAGAQPLEQAFVFQGLAKPPMQADVPSQLAFVLVIGGVFGTFGAYLVFQSLWAPAVVLLLLVVAYAVAFKVCQKDPYLIDILMRTLRQQDVYEARVDVLQDLRSRSRRRQKALQRASMMRRTRKSVFSLRPFF